MQQQKADHASIVNWLSASPACEGLFFDDLSKIAQRMEVQTFESKEVLAKAGEEVTEFWIVVEGFVEGIFEDIQGNEKFLGVIGPGESIGDASLIENTLRPFHFRSQSAGKLMVLSAEDFHQSIEQHPVLLRNLFRKLSARFKQVVGAMRRRLNSPRLAIVASSTQARILAERLVARLGAAGESLSVWTDHADAIRNSKTWPETQLLNELELGAIPLSQPTIPNVDRQIVILHPSDGGGFDFRQVQNCDEVLVLVEPKSADRTLAWLRTLSGNDELLKRIRLVWILGGNAPVAPCYSMSEFRLERSDMKAHIETAGNQLTRLELQGLDRLVRLLRGFSIGIALAGGGAKGMAHLGVLRVLEEAGITFDTMSGTSAGAMAGILYSSGMAPAFAAESFQRDLTPSRLFRRLPSWPNLYLLSQFRRRAWDHKLRNYLHDWRLEQLPIPFAALTVDLIQGRSVVRRTGDAVHAILESINLPVISRAILRDGMALVDGGMLNNLPADVLSNSGCDFVVGVDVSRRMRHEFAGNRPDTPTDKMKNASSLDTLMRIFECQAHNLGAFRKGAVDFWIAPDTSTFALADFHRTLEISAAGEQCAISILPDLQNQLAAFEKRLSRF